MLRLFLCHLPVGHFKWKCANVFSGVGNAYSQDAAKDFRLAASKNNIEVCATPVYVSSSGDMHKAINEIMEKKCCKVNVVFGAAQDLAFLFLEAHKQGYDGEWVVGDNVKSSLDSIVNNLKDHLDNEDTVHKILRGM